MTAHKENSHRWRRRLKRLMVIGGVLIAVLLVLVVALPVWLPWALQPGLKWGGIDVGDCRRVGYSRLVISELQWRDAGTVVQAGQVEAWMPTVWLWRSLFGDEKAGDPGTPSYVEVEDWKVELGEETEPVPKPEPGTGGIDSVWAILEQAHGLVPTIQTWLPSAELTNGVLDIGSDRFTIPSIQWRQAVLTIRAASAAREQEVALNLDLEEPEAIPIRIELLPLEVVSKLKLTRASSVWDLTGETEWHDERLRFSASFKPGTWLPEKAEVNAERFRVPGSVLQVSGYETVTASLAAKWEEKQFSLDVDGAAKPVEPGKPETPPIKVNVHADGSTERVSVDELRVDSPWFQIRLGETAELTRAAKGLAAPATISTEVDLGAVAFLPVQGRISGTIRCSPARLSDASEGDSSEGPGELGESFGLPMVDFAFTGSDLQGLGMTVQDVRLEGNLAWPTLALEALRVELGADSYLVAKGRSDLKAQAISDAEWKIQGEAFNRFLPETFRYEGLAGNGEISGGWTSLSHSGQVRVQQLSLPSVSPLTDVVAEWNGEQLNMEAIRFACRAGESRLSTEAACDVAFGDDGGTNARLDLITLTLEKQGKPLYELAEPTTLTVRSDKVEGESTSQGWHVQLDSLEWGGDEQGVRASGDFRWPEQGELTLTGKGARMSHFDDFLRLPDETVELSRLDLDLQWDNGPADIDLSFNGEWAAPDGKMVGAAMALKGSEAGMVIDRLSVLSEESEVLTGHGEIPVLLEPSGDRLVRVKSGSDLTWRASSVANAEFWKRVESWTEVSIEEPTLTMELDGSLESPSGKLVLNATSMKPNFMEGSEALPPLEGFNVEIDVQPGAVELKDFAVAVKDQEIRAKGSLPLPDKGVMGVLNDPSTIAVDKAQGHLWMRDAEIEALAGYFPKLLAPNGRVNFDVAVRPGPNLSGTLTVSGAATRPIAPMGPIREIEALIRFTEQRAEIGTFSGKIGGEPVKIGGGAHISEEGALAYDITVSGDNVPLARQPGMILRSDLDLSVNGDFLQGTVVSGQVRLHDCLFLQDLEMLIPGSLAQPQKRPPFFSVGTPPLADWKLDVEIKGDRFIQVRTPVFQGRMSTNMRLQGTLQEPMALGETRIDSGMVKFPFGNLDIRQGFVTLTSENPYRPRLFVTAKSQVFGYQVQMNVEGYADEPAVTFSSTPPLTSEAILVMLSAGELPKEEHRFSSQQKAGRLAMYFGKDLLNRLGADKETTDRLTVRTGENISEKGRLTYSVEYRLTDRWSAVGELDRFGELNAGVKWKVYSQ